MFDPTTAATSSLMPQEAALVAVISYSQTLSGWALLIVGASVLTLLQRSYLRPGRLRYRLVYLLYVLGWSFLAASIYFGTRVQQVALAARLAIHQITGFKQILNSDLKFQIWCLSSGVAAFVGWLLWYLLFWIFVQRPEGEA
jgi:hypothetical protein